MNPIALLCIICVGYIAGCIGLQMSPLMPAPRNILQFVASVAMVLCLLRFSGNL